MFSTVVSLLLSIVCIITVGSLMRGKAGVFCYSRLESTTIMYLRISLPPYSHYIILTYQYFIDKNYSPAIMRLGIPFTRTSITLFIIFRAIRDDILA